MNWRIIVSLFILILNKIMLIFVNKLNKLNIMNLKLECSFKAAAKPEQFGENKLQKFYVDIDKESKYPQIAEFQIWNNKINISDLKEGDKIDVHFNINGRKYEKDGKSYFFQSLNCWKIEKLSEPAKEQENNKQEDEPIDDLPF